MFEFEIKSIKRSTGQPDKNGLLHSSTTSDVLIQHIETEDDGSEFGLRRMVWIESGWTVTDFSVRHAEPASSLWMLVHTQICRPDGVVAYEGAGLDLDDCVQALFDEKVHLSLSLVKKYELRETSGEYEIWIPVADCQGAFAFSGITINPEVVIGLDEIEKTAASIVEVL